MSKYIGETSRQRLIRAGGAIAVVLLAVLGFKFFQPAPKPRGAAAIPVSVEKVTRESVPVYRIGFGTVRAFNSVVLKVRVDGALDKVLFNEGDEVKQGQVLAQIDARPYQAALNVVLAKKAQDEAMLTKARGDLGRFQTLNKSQFTSQQNLEAQQALVAQAEATLKGDEAAVENARVQLGYTTITAPVSGRIGLRQVDMGNILRASDNVGLAVISTVHPISVIFSLPASELSIITKARSQAGTPVIAYSSDDKVKLAEGTLLTVDSAVDETNGSIKLKATFQNESNSLTPGQSVSAHILLDTQNGVLTVPARAVQRGPNGLFVYALKPDSTVEVRPIETSETVGDKMVLVSATLAEGDTIVTGGQARLEPGAKVSLRAEPKAESKDPAKGG